MKISTTYKNMTGVGLLFLIVSCLTGAHAEAQETAEPDKAIQSGPVPSKSEENRPGKLIKGSVTISELSAPTGIEWDQKTLPKLRQRFQLTGQMGEQPEGVWYRVPEWLAGTWISTEINPTSYSPEPKEEGIGCVRDAKGDIWDFSRGLLAGQLVIEAGEGKCEALTVMGGNIPVDLSAKSFEIWKRNVAITQNLKNHRIVRALITRTSEKFLLQDDGTVKQVCNMTHLVNQNFDGVSDRTDWSRLYTRRSAFQDHASPELVAEFHEFLKTHGLSELIPPQPETPRAFNLPPIQCLFAK